MGKVVGIDLGTSNSAIACKTVSTEILPNAQGDVLTPSCVYFNPQIPDPFAPEATLVGKAALHWQKQEPGNVIVAIKRLMGRGIDDDHVQKMIKECKPAYEIEALSHGTQNSLSVVIHHQQGMHQVSPEDISAIILKQLIENGEHYLHDHIDTAIITVPAYFNDKQKHATQIAAGKAGLKVLQLLPEPTAAAISFSMIELEGEGTSTVMVYDFGGGTLDISILTIGGTNIIEHGKTGDMWLGGNDIDEVMVALILAHANKELDTPIQVLMQAKPPLEQKRLKLEFLAQAEHAKIKLSTQEQVYVELIDVLEDDAGSIDIDVCITRAEFEEKIKPYIDNSIRLAKQLLEEIDFSTDLIDQVLLVGGTSQIPLVSQQLASLFGQEKVVLHDRPTLAIAEGAALLAHKTGDIGSKTHGVGEIAHTCAHDYYLELAGGLQHLLIPRHTPLPTELKFDVKLTSHEQVLARFKFLNKVNDSFESIGDLWVNLNSDQHWKKSSGDADEGALSLVLKVDANNLVQISVFAEGQSERQITKTLSRGKVDEKLMQHLENAINNINTLPQSESTYYLTLDYEERATFIVDSINKVMDSDTESINEQGLQETEAMLSLGDAIIKENDSVFGNIWYMENLIDNYSHLVAKTELKTVKDKLRVVKRLNIAGKPKDLFVARDELWGLCSDLFAKYEGHNRLMNAIETAHENNLHQQASELQNCISKYQQTKKQAHIDKAFSIADAINRTQGKQQRDICTEVTI